MKRLISVLLCVFVVLCTISVVATADWSTRKNTPQIVEDVTDGDGNAEDSAPSTPIYKNFLKNGDFRDGLNYWTTSGGVSVVNNSAHFEGIASFSQKIEINPTKTYTLTGKADLIDAFENWSYAYLRAVFYNASGVKVGNKMDVGSALLTYGIVTNRLKGVDENGIFIRQFGAGTGVVIPEQATEMELFFEGSTERTIWMVDNLCLIDNETLEEEGPSLDESEEESSGSESSSLIRKVLWDSDLSETLDPIGKEYIPYTNQFISKAISDDIEANGVIIRDEYYEITVTGYTTSGFSDLGLLTPGGVIQQNSKDPQYGYLTDKPATVTAIFRPNSQTATMNSGETKVCFYDCFYEYGIRNEICLSHLTVVVYRNSDLQTTTTTSTTMPQVPGINKTLIYNIDFEEENAGTVLKQNGALVGEVVEWPAGSGNHALKYIMDSTTYKTTGVHPYIIPSGLSEVMAIQGEIPDGGEIRFSIDVGCDEPLQTGNPEYGTYMYAEMITADDGENYFRYNRTFIPGVGSFKTGEFSLSNYEVTPVAGTDNGRIALFDDGTLGAGMQGSAIYYDNIKLEWYGDWTPTNDCLLTYLYTREPIAHSDVNDAYTGNPFELPDIEAHKLATIKLWSGRVLDTVTFSNHRAVLENDSINEAIQNDIVVNGHIANDEHYLICTTARWKEDGGYVVPGFVTGDYEFWGDVDEDADYKYIGEEPYYDYGHFCSSSKEDQDGNCCAEKMTTASKLAFFSIDDENNNTLYISDITIYVYRNAYSLYRNKYNLTEPSQSNITTMSTESTTAIASTSSPKPLYGDNLIINADCFESDSSSPAFGWNVLSGDVRIDGSMMIYNDGVTSSKISVGLREAIKPNTEYMFDVGSVSGDGAQLVVNGLEGEYSRTYFGVGDGPVCFKTPQDTSAVSFMVYVEAFAGAADTIVLDNFVLSEILNGENSEESEPKASTSATIAITSTTSTTSTTTSMTKPTATTTISTATSKTTTATQQVPGINKTLIYNIDFEEENAGSVLMANGEVIGEVVEWPAGSGNHALKYVADSSTYKTNGVHPYIYPSGLSRVLALQGAVPSDGRIRFSIDVGCDEPLQTGNPEYGMYMYAMMLTADDVENYFANETGTFVPGVGSFKTGSFSLDKYNTSFKYNTTPIEGTGNGFMSLCDDGTIGAGMQGKAFYYDNIILEWVGPWSPVTDCQLTYLDTGALIAQSDVNDAYTGPSTPSEPPTHFDGNPVLIYNIDFEEENAGSVLTSYGEPVGEVVEWPAGSGNHALKYVMDSTTYKSNGVHPYIWLSGLKGLLATQGNIPDGGKICFSIDTGCDDQLKSGTPEYGLCMYAMMLTADEGETYLLPKTGAYDYVPGVGEFNTGEFFMNHYQVSPVFGTGNGLIALLDDGTLGRGMQGSAIYYDNIKLEWYGDWTPTKDVLLTYLDTHEPIAHSDVNDAYYGRPRTTTATTTTTTVFKPEPKYGENLIINADCFESDSSSPAFGWNVLSGDVRVDGSMMIYNDGVTSSKISVGLREAIKPNTEYMFDVESVSGEGAQLVVNGLEGEYSRTYFGVGDGPVCFKTSQDTSAVSFMVYVEAFAGATDTIVLDNFVLSEILNGENSEESESEIETSTTSTTTSTTSSTSTTTSTISTTSTTTTTTSTTEPTTSITSTIITTSTMPITKMSDTTIVTTSTGTENGGGDESTESFESEPDMILGDATGDGSVDMKDVLMIRKALAGISDIKNSVCADANKDGSLDMKDVLLVRKYLAHMVEL